MMISQFESGAQPRRRARRVEEKQKRIMELKRFESNLMTLEEYVRAVSAHV